MTAPDLCETCEGNGEIFGHAHDCYNDSCALNGDIDSCNGLVTDCPVCDGTGRTPPPRCAVCKQEICSHTDLEFAGLSPVDEDEA